MLSYHNGDLFKLFPKDKKILIPHVVNNQGGWGAGFVIPLGKNFPKAEEQYRLFSPMQLGHVSYSRTNNVIVANMCAQDGFRVKNNPRPLRYNALVYCMESVALYCKNLALKEIWCPRFGSGLAEGDWGFIEELIEDCWLSQDIEVNVCIPD